MIRPATESDLPRLVAMGERFRSETGYNHLLSRNPAQMRQLAEDLIARDGILLSERAGEPVGMLGYILYPHFFSGETVSGEVFWWVEPEHRGEGVKLLREAEKRARERGARRMQMIAPSEKVAAFYVRIGYEYVESTYQKSL